MSGVDTGLGRQNKPRKNKNTGLKLIVLMTFFILTLISTFIFSYKYVTDADRYKDIDTEINIDPDKGIPVEIPLGSDTSTIANILKDKGIIKHPFIFKLLSRFNGYDGTYKSGTHIVSKELSYDELMRVISSKPVSIKVTIPEGYTFKQIVDTLVAKKLIDPVKFSEVANNEEFDYEFLKSIPKRDNRLEGYLFPDTYEFDIKAGEKEIINTMLKNFDNKFKSKYYEQAKKLNMTVDKVITLASIIEREGKGPEDRAKISGVFYNRLTGRYNAPRKLESCATIQYIYLYRNQDTSDDIRKRVLKGIITDEDKKLNDPYNTYKYEGLPPGPICNPGEASIIAALNPEATDYLYFVATGDGRTDFSRTLAEHQAKMKKYGLK